MQFPPFMGLNARDQWVPQLIYFVYWTPCGMEAYFCQCQHSSSSLHCILTLGRASNLIVNPHELQTEPSTPFKTSPEIVTPIAAPTPVNNCPECTLWLPPGTLACPECHAIIYAPHLRRIAELAARQEQGSEWAQARETWKQALLWLPAETRQAESVREHISQIDARFRAEDDTKAKWTRRLGPFAPIAFFLLKAKTFLFAIFKLKFLFSFLAFFGVYWALFGWRFGPRVYVSHSDSRGSATTSRLAGSG